MTPLTRDLLERFLRIAGDRLTGDWVLMGGTVLTVVGITHRVTLDIALAGPEGATNAETLALMEIAQSLGLAPETINQAGALFLRRVPGWQDDLVLLHRGATAAIHPPGVTLLVLLKLGRLGEADLADCQAMIAWGRRHGEPADTRRLEAAIARELVRRPPPGKRARLDALREAIAAPHEDG